MCYGLDKMPVSFRRQLVKQVQCGKCSEKSPGELLVVEEEGKAWISVLTLRLVLGVACLFIVM